MSARPSAPDPPEMEKYLWNGYERAALGFDVGANCGQSIGHMLGICNLVVAFEPNPDSYAVMQGRWETDERVELSSLAVSSRCGSVQLAQLGGEQLATGQLVTPGTKGMEWDPGDWSSVLVNRYPCVNLDWLAGRYGTPEFIKVDTEGHEQQVIAGASQLLSAACPPDWLIEFHSPEGYAACVSVLEEQGEGVYDIQILRHPGYSEKSRMWYQHGWIKALAR